MKEIDSVSHSMAKLFYDQCFGTTDGHMAAIPNNPVLNSIVVASGVRTQEQFADFIREVADWLDGGGRD